MVKSEREEFKKTLKVLQGGMPSKGKMKSIVTKQFEELKMELAKVKDYPYTRIELIQGTVLEYQKKYGPHLEKIESSDTEILDRQYGELNQLLKFVKEAQEMMQNEEKAKCQNAESGIVK